MAKHRMLEMNVTSCGPAVSFAKRKAAKKTEIPAELDIDDPFAWGTGRNHGSCPPSPVMDHEDQADDDVVVEDLEEELRLDVDAAADGEEALIDGLEDPSAHMDGEDAASAVDGEALMDVVLDSASLVAFRAARQVVPPAVLPAGLAVDVGSRIGAASISARLRNMACLSDGEVIVIGIPMQTMVRKRIARSS